MDDENPKFTFDGQIVFESNESGPREIHIMNGDGTNRNQLTDSNDEDINPIVFPDETHIVFISHRDGGSGEVYIMDFDGTNERRITDTSDGEGNPSIGGT